MNVACDYEAPMQMLTTEKYIASRAYEFLGELKHPYPCRHDAQNDSEMRKLTHTFSINILTTIYSFFFPS